ncbi:sigma-70 family RNA polymerase sigma factor [Kribbella sp. CA-247076]|uniref:sigma-70 family RNA polymerase sigma factor n=1 Tax=Kribbella sp. CA-247076 TaxID=3239941 RepID=UPI003D8FE91A
MDIDPEAWRDHRNYLMAVAYRLLGSVSEAEDAVHEAYLRLRRHDGDAIEDVRRWLTTVVSRICLDELKSARVRRERYLGTWLPEPLVGPDAQPGPDDRLALKESVQTAMLIVLETLTPPERIAFVLHDVFDLTFDEIAGILDRSATASRQLASRARTRVRRGVPRFDVSAADWYDGPRRSSSPPAPSTSPPARSPRPSSTSSSPGRPETRTARTVGRFLGVVATPCWFLGSE